MKQAQESCHARRHHILPQRGGYRAHNHSAPAVEGKQNDVKIWDSSRGVVGGWVRDEIACIRENPHARPGPHRIPRKRVSGLCKALFEGTAIHTFPLFSGTIERHMHPTQEKGGGLGDKGRRVGQQLFRNRSG